MIFGIPFKSCCLSVYPTILLYQECYHIVIIFLLLLTVQEDVIINVEAYVLFYRYYKHTYI